MILLLLEAKEPFLVLFRTNFLKSVGLKSNLQMGTYLNVLKLLSISIIAQEKEKIQLIEDMLTFSSSPTYGVSCHKGPPIKKKLLQAFQLNITVEQAPLKL